jgi:hypothetical protein
VLALVYLFPQDLKCVGLLSRSGEMKADCEVMDILKLVLNGELGDKELLSKLLKMTKGNLIKGILTLIPRVVACDAKIDTLERKVKKIQV